MTQNLENEVHNQTSGLDKGTKYLTMLGGTLIGLVGGHLAGLEIDTIKEISDFTHSLITIGGGTIGLPISYGAYRLFDYLGRE